MKKKFLKRINLILGTLIFTLIGMAMNGCVCKYGSPEPPDEPYPVLYGPAPDVEEVVDTTANSPVVEE